MKCHVFYGSVCKLASELVISTVLSKLKDVSRSQKVT